MQCSCGKLSPTFKIWMLSAQHSLSVCGYNRAVGLYHYFISLSSPYCNVDLTKMIVSHFLNVFMLQFKWVRKPPVRLNISLSYRHRLSKCRSSTVAVISSVTKLEETCGHTVVPGDSISSIYSSTSFTSLFLCQRLCH